MQNISWYLNLYYSYRDYPINSINIKYKKSQLKTVYNNLMKKMFNNFDIDIHKEIQQEKIDEEDANTINQKLKGQQKTIRFQDNNSIQSLDRQSNPDLSDYNLSQSIKGSIEQKHNELSKAESDSCQNILEDNQKVDSTTKSKNLNKNYQNLINRDSVGSSQVGTLYNIKSSKQIINSNPHVKPTTSKRQKQMDLVKICQTMEHNQKNMDVFYQLMIKMIRLTLKKISVQIDQQLKKKKQTVKNVQTIQQLNQDKQNQDNQEEADFSLLEQNKIQSRKSIHTTQNQQNSEQFMRLQQLKTSSKQSNSSKDQIQSKYTFVINYANKLSRMKQIKKAKQKKEEQQRQKIDAKVKMFNFMNDFQDESLNKIQVPNSVEEIKFQFLKYCTLTKIHYQQETIFTANSQKSHLKSSNGLISSQQNFNSLNNGQQNQTNKQKNYISPQAQHQEQQQKKYIAELTQLSDKQTEDINTINQNSTYQIQKIVLKLVNIQMNSFNLVLNHYFSKLQQNSTIVNVIGFDAIAQSMYQMALGQQAKSNGASMQVCLGDSFKSNIFANYRLTNKNSQSNNILLQTWLDLIIFSQNPNTLYQIIEQLSKIQTIQQKKLNINKLKSKTWTPDISQTPQQSHFQQDKKQKTHQFKQKMISLLNFLILNTTKSIFLQSLSKANFLSVVTLDMLSNQHRSLKQFQLRKLKDSQIFSAKNTKHEKKYLKHCLNQQQVITCYDLTYQKQVWKKDALNLIIYKWNKIIKIIFQQQVKNPKIYWQLIFQKCASMINRQLSLLAALVFYLMEMYQNLQLKIEQIKKKSYFSKKQKFQVQKNQKMQKDLQNIIREHLGCRQIFGKEDIQLNQNEQFIYSNLNSMIDSKGLQRKKQQSFANRQQKTEQLHKWEQALRQNIFIYEQYIDNILSINQLFKSESYFKAAWFINYHEQTKQMIKKVKKQNIRILFLKFNNKLPKIWQTLNKQQVMQQQQNKKSVHKRHNAIRYRISSIKKKKQLSDKQKQSVIINYMIKTELELYQSYTKSHILNSQDDNTTMTTIISSNNNYKTNLPFIFQDETIRNILLFPLVKVSSSKNSPQIIQSNLFGRRNDKPHLTMKLNGLSQFSPVAKNNLLSPRQFKVSSSIGRTNENDKKKQLTTGGTKPGQNIEDEPFINEYQIDVSKLETINYQNQEIQFLIQINQHLKFINQINFQYEYYHWKKNAYQRVMEQTKKGDQIRLQVKKTQAKSNFLLKRVTSNLSDNKNTQLNDLEGLLTTYELERQIKQINKVFQANRSQFLIYKSKHPYIYQRDSEKVIEKIPYQEKIDQIIKRTKIHNESLRLIVQAALEAKNYWRSATDNIIPQQLFHHFDSKKYQSTSGKNNKNIQFFSQLQLQDRYFGQKILQKMEQYINDYRDLCQEMKYNYEQLQNQQLNQEEQLTRQKNKRQLQQQAQNQNQNQNCYKNQNERSNKKKPSIIKIVQQNKKPQVRFYSLIESLICRKQTPKMNRFQIASQYYQLSQKILRVNCYLASFYVQRKVFKNIVSSTELSQQKYAKVKIIGKKYFQKIKQYSQSINNIEKQKQFSEQSLAIVEHVYQKKILIILVSLMQLIYKGNQEKKNFCGKWKSFDEDNIKKKMQTKRDLSYAQTQKSQQTNYQVCKKTLKKYSELVKKYLKHRLQKNTEKIFQKQGLSLIQNQINGKQSDFSHIPKLISQAFQFGQQSTESLNQQKFILNLKKMRFQETDQGFLKAYINIAQKEMKSIEQFQTQQQKCEFLKKKFYYFILRQLYFYLYYDIDCLEVKSAYSKKNYELYQNRIVGFYDQIIKKSYHDFQTKKQLQLKKRSIYLQNYLLKYEQQPIIIQEEKSLNKLLVCLFNQIMIIYTEQIKVQMKKKSVQTNDLVLKKTQSQLPLHYNYFSSQFYTAKKPKECDQINQIADSNIMLDLFQAASSQGLFKIGGHNKSNFYRKSNIKMNSNNSILTQQNDSQGNIIPKQQTQLRLNDETFTVFSLEDIEMYQAINIYKSLKTQYLQNMNKQFNSMKLETNTKDPFKRQMLTQMELQIIKTNQQSLVSLLKKEVAEKINKLKFNLVRKNLISRIQKLYINIDVRHKVFQSFQDKILSYQMQKAKIYHQYMDYIRGLKLDVYSHIANQDSLPYIKIINAIKFYRLEIKKEELQNKVSQQFGKNLNRWNQGIQDDLKNYNSWLCLQQRYWESNQAKNISFKKQLLQIYDSIQKELKRQLKKRQKQYKQMRQIQKMKQNNLFSKKTSQFQKELNILKKVAITKINNPFSNHKQNLMKHIAIQLPKQVQLNTQQIKNVITNSKKHSTPKSATFYHSKNNNYKSVHESLHISPMIQNRFLVSANSKSRNSLHSKQKTLYRASTAITRDNNIQKKQKEVQKSQSQFRGIKMKFIQRSMKNIQPKNLNQSQSNIQNSRVFKKSQNNKYVSLQKGYKVNAFSYHKESFEKNKTSFENNTFNQNNSKSSKEIKYDARLIFVKKIKKSKECRSVSALNQRMIAKNVAFANKEN